MTNDEDAICEISGGQVLLLFPTGFAMTSRHKTAMDGFI